MSVYSLVNQNNQQSCLTDDPWLPVQGEHVRSQLPVLRAFSEQTDTLLLQGPSGAGKSRLATWCHHHSHRSEWPFEVVDLATVPDDMKLAALFGWRKGAFTGAHQSSKGAIGRAHGGTLFIDEIDKLPLDAQAGLLQLLESGTYSILGDDTGVKNANVRFIIGTNASLPDLVKQGLFREDLYYRINILPIALPPLTARRDEITSWATYMLERCAAQQDTAQQNTDVASENTKHKLTSTKAYRFSSEAEQLLMAQSWPGNLRQLDNIVRRSFALCRCEQSQEQATVIDKSCLQAALAMDLTASTVKNLPARSGDIKQDMSSCLWQAAELFVEYAQQEQQQNNIVDLDCADAFKGYVLSNALKKLLKKKSVYQLFGKEKAVVNRTYQREIKRELEKTRTLEEKLESYIEIDWQTLLENS